MNYLHTHNSKFGLNVLENCVIITGNTKDTEDIENGIMSGKWEVVLVKDFNLSTENNNNDLLQIGITLYTLFCGSPPDLSTRDLDLTEIPSEATRNFVKECLHSYTSTNVQKLLSSLDQISC